MHFPIERIWIDDDVVDEPLVREMINRLPGAKVLWGDRCNSARTALEAQHDPVSQGKRILRLRRHRGAFVKPCPGTREYICCGLEILHIGQGCPMDCTYCALQVYFNRPVLEVFVNVEEMISDLRSYLVSSQDKFHRICTGEFTDSLALDPLTGLSSRLVDFFSDVENASLEIKTKTDFIDPLLNLKSSDRVVLSWSLNSGLIANHEEKRAIPIELRLAAAQKAVKRGYRVGFHFDPIIPHPGWQEEYCKTVNLIFRALDPSGIAWISMGVLRFVPGLKEIARHRHGLVRYFHDGFIQGLDGKCRLQADRRIEIYRNISDAIRRQDPNARIYLCMESPHVWKEALGIDMSSSDCLDAYLSRAFGRSLG
jgi:spore photoproduct lyase